ncbi:hypothetical protein CAPTEDRAFT_201951 [Capitella teleta]|uniref:Uncharacterized protein n=1 Tax=Capitella teleta TaxID=283909 RepID=R7TD16_CAPTE|nr:hypothetical protein CAPTEDRAFT_201951 [Capitella teleta]|eukprot:ELT91372.1 hypothetical protein CAPTEDRAFT_201951 [Capitella teleta]
MPVDVGKVVIDGFLDKERRHGSQGRYIGTGDLTSLIGFANQCVLGSPRRCPSGKQTGICGLSRDSYTDRNIARKGGIFEASVWKVRKPCIGSLREYTYSQCIVDCHTNTLINKCGCKLSFMPVERNPGIGSGCTRKCVGACDATHYTPMLSSFQLSTSGINRTLIDVPVQHKLNSTDLVLKTDEDTFSKIIALMEDIIKSCEIVEWYTSSNIFDTSSSLSARLELAFKELMGIYKKEVSKLMELKHRPQQAYLVHVKPYLSFIKDELKTGIDVIKRTASLLGVNFLKILPEVSAQSLGTMLNSSISDILTVVRRILNFKTSSAVNVSEQAKLLFKPENPRLNAMVPTYLIAGKHDTATKEAYVGVLYGLLCLAMDFGSVKTDSCYIDSQTNDTKCRISRSDEEIHMDEKLKQVVENLNVSCGEHNHTMSNRSFVASIMERYSNYRKHYEALIKNMSLYEEFILKEEDEQLALFDLSLTASVEDTFKKISDTKKQSQKLIKQIAFSQFNTYFDIERMSQAAHNLGDLMTEFKTELTLLYRYLDTINQASTLEDFFPDLSENITSVVKDFILWRKPTSKLWSSELIKYMLSVDDARGAIPSGISAFLSTGARDRVLQFYDTHSEKSRESLEELEDLIAKTWISKTALYTTTLSGNVGGFMGLLLGASVISWVEIIDYVILGILHSHDAQKRGADRKDKSPSAVML